MTAHHHDRIPSLRVHKPTRRAVATLNGRDVYFGKAGTDTSKRAYERTLAEWLAAGRQLPGTVNPGVYLCAHLANDFLDWNEKEFRGPDGSLSRGVDNVRLALRPLVELYGDTPAAEFGPKRLTLLGERWIAAGLSRGTVNDRLSHVKRAFKWATREEKVPASTFHGLQAVGGFRRGRCGAREGDGVKPVPQEDIDATLPFLPPPVAAMAQVQLLTGMRPGEVLILRWCDMDTSGSVWQYRPHHHKNEWRGHERVIDIGPKAQAILTQFKRPALSDAYIFSPTIAELRRRERQRAARKTPLWPSHLKAQDRKRKATRSRPPRDRYDVNSYRHAVVRACHRAGVAPWSPGQLRHNAATLIRQRFGLEGARAVLGHRLVETTQVYAERDRCISLDIAREVG